MPFPTPAEVLYCLVSDRESEQYATFEEFADSMGYDKDSRKGEKIFNACLEIARNMNRVLGYAVVSEIAEAVREM